MMKIEKANFSTVNWIFEFLADDLDKVTDLEFSKRVLDAQYHFVDQWGVDWLGPSGSANTRVTVLSPQRYPRNYPWRETLKKIQVRLREIAKELSQDQPKNQGLIWKVEGVSLLFEIGPKGMFIKFNPLSGILDFHKIPKPDELVRLAERTFYISAHGLPPNAIEPCRECGNYFLHLTKKVKYFCSPRCAVRNLSRQRRERDPDGYRAKQREIMARRYKEQQAKKLERPVEKIRFQKKSIYKKQ